MYLDLPFLMRCCFCFPLRRGLIAYAYLKLIIEIILIVVLSLLEADFIINNIQYEEMLKKSIIYIAILIPLILDVIFLFIFVISAHTKNPRLMRIYLVYSINAFIVSNITFVIFLGITGYYVSKSTNNKYFYMLLCLLVGALNAVISFYVICLLRSLIMKLNNDYNVVFENQDGKVKSYPTGENSSGKPQPDKVALNNETPKNDV